MPVVVDASVAYHWTIPTDHTVAAVSLLSKKVGLIAPDLIIPEVSNALFTTANRTPEYAQRIMDGIEFLPRWFSEIAPTSPLRFQALRLASELRHPVYDCFYLALAVQRGVRMITLDTHFIRKVEQNPALADTVLHIDEHLRA